MSLQGDSKVHRTQEGDHIIVTCACGEGFEHGQIELRRDKTEPHPGYFMEVWFRPHYALWERIKQAWNVLWGRTIFCDNFLNPATAKDLAWWLNDPEGKGY